MLTIDVVAVDVVGSVVVNVFVSFFGISYPFYAFKMYQKYDRSL